MRSLEESKIDRGWKSFLKFRERRLVGLPTGLEALDKYILGLGGITLLQGETGANKSTLGLQILYHNLKLGASGLILDAENGEGRLRSRLMCMANQVAEVDIMTCSVDQLKKYREPVLNLNLHIYTESTTSLTVVEERIQEMLSLYTGNILVLVDSVQALAPLDSDQRVSLEKWMVFFDRQKVLADGRLTFIVTSEINRASYEKTGIGSAKGSNQLEFKSELVGDLRINKDSGNITIQICKNRDGLKGARFTLEKVFSDPSNPMSFTFTLRAAEDAVLEGAQL